MARRRRCEPWAAGIKSKRERYDARPADQSVRGLESAIPLAEHGPRMEPPVSGAETELSEDGARWRHRSRRWTLKDLC